MKFISIPLVFCISNTVYLFCITIYKPSLNFHFFCIFFINITSEFYKSWYRIALYCIINTDN